MTSEGLTRPGRADHSGEDFGVVFLSWLGLIIGWVILAALRRRLDPGDPGPPDAPRSPARPATTALVQPAPVHRDRRCGPRHGKAAAAMDRMVALLLFIGRALAQMIPIALHNRSLRRLPTTRIREVASDWM